MSPGHRWGWVIVGTLALTVTTSYGVLMYAFPVLLVAMESDLGWSRSSLTGAYSLAALAGGGFAVPVGRWVDRFGARVVMTAGSAVASVLLVAWARADRVETFYAVWIGLGACTAALFYEPAFVVVSHWFRRHRGRALTVITVAGALASTIFVPLTSVLLVRVGWRGAVLGLAGLFAVLTIAPHALLLRGRPADLGLGPDGDAATEPALGRWAEPERSIDARRATGSRPFRWITASFFLSTLASTVFAVHLIPLLLERDYAWAFASTALATLGVTKVGGRLALQLVTARWSVPVATTGVFLIQTVGLLAMIILPGVAGIWIGIALFGAADGASTPARASILAIRFGPRELGAIGGVMSLFLSVGRALAPVGASVVRDASDGYGLLLWLLVGITTGAAACLFAASSPARPAEETA